MSIEQMHFAQQLSLINAKKPTLKPSVVSHAPVWGVPVGAAATDAVNKLKTLKKPPDTPPIAKELVPLSRPVSGKAASSSDCPQPAPVEMLSIVAGAGEAASSSDGPHPAPVEESSIVAAASSEPESAPRLAQPTSTTNGKPSTKTKTTTKARFNPRAPHLTRGQRLVNRDEALLSLHRHRTNVALPLDLVDFLGSAGRVSKTVLSPCWRIL